MKVRKYTAWIDLIILKCFTFRLILFRPLQHSQHAIVIFQALMWPKQKQKTISCDLSHLKFISSAYIFEIAPINVHTEKEKPEWNVVVDIKEVDKYF